MIQLSNEMIKESKMNIQKLGDRYRDVIDAIDEMSARHKDEMREMKVLKQDIDAKIQTWLIVNNLEKVDTSRITLALKTKQYTNVSDWDEFYQFIEEKGDMEFLQKRAKSTEVMAYIEETGEVPPGIEITTEFSSTEQVTRVPCRSRSRHYNVCTSGRWDAPPLDQR
jgi:hypothetical protein